MADKRRRTDDAAVQALFTFAAENGIDVETAWDRYDAQQPQCGFGKLGLCCRICNMGPCRIDPFGNGAKQGVCGASADTIAARHLARMIAAGTACHSDHGRSIVHTLHLIGTGETKDYQIKNPDKLLKVAAEYGIKTDGLSIQQVAKQVAEMAYEDFGRQHGHQHFVQRAPEKRQQLWERLGVTPGGIDREVVNLMNITHMGVDNDYKSILRHGVRGALADGWGGSMIATDLGDAMFGMPKPVRSAVNLGILQKDEVNVIVHGHEPVLSEMMVEASRDPELLALAKEKGANGITLGGICCTANEILMRHGVPIAGNFLTQEVCMMTGVVDAMVVDVQCVMPGLAEMSRCTHTKLITTNPRCHFPDADVQHIELDEKNALEIARKIVRIAIENYTNRDKSRINIPVEKAGLIAGFTAENTYNFLGGHYRATYRPLNNAIIEGRIRGLAGVVGCNNMAGHQDRSHLAMTMELIKNDVLVVQTGCAAIACAKHELLTPEGAKYAGPGLREVCEAVGIPPVLHLGSCVDNSRILITLANVLKEGGLGEDYSDIPVAGAAPEWMSEKAIAIGFYVVASGIFTVFGGPQPVMGSKNVADYLLGGMTEDYGACFSFEADPVKAARQMIDHIDKKREALKLRPMLYEYESAPATDDLVNV